MIVVCVLYPYEPSMRFDEEYYLSHHMELIKEVWGDTAASVRVLLNGGELGEEPPQYRAVAEIGFDSPETLQQAMAHPRAGELNADLPNFTDATPKMQMFRLADVI